MKLLAPVLLFLMLSCGNSKLRKDLSRQDSAGVSQSVPLPDSIKIKNNSPVDSTVPDSFQNRDGVNGKENGEEIRYGGFRKTPACIREMIKKFSAADVTNPPRKIYQYDYNGKIVFYVPALCCDFYSDLYDMDCNLIGHPDGGYTGRGDGTYADFGKERKNEKLVWEDKR